MPVTFEDAAGSAVPPRPVRDTANDMVAFGAFDGLMNRVDAGELQLTGEGGSCPR
jgi:hypothetical protein